MKKFLFLFLVLGSLLSSCSKEDNTNEDIQGRWEWKRTNYSDGGYSYPSQQPLYYLSFLAGNKYRNEATCFATSEEGNYKLRSGGNKNYVVFYDNNGTELLELEIYALTTGKITLRQYITANNICFHLFEKN